MSFKNKMPHYWASIAGYSLFMVLFFLSIYSYFQLSYAWKKCAQFPFRCIMTSIKMNKIVMGKYTVKHLLYSGLIIKRLAFTVHFNTKIALFQRDCLHLWPIYGRYVHAFISQKCVHLFIFTHTCARTEVHQRPCKDFYFSTNWSCFHSLWPDLFSFKSCTKTNKK